MRPPYYRLGWRALQEGPGWMQSWLETAHTFGAPARQVLESLPKGGTLPEFPHVTITRTMPEQAFLSRGDIARLWGVSKRRASRRVVRAIAEGWIERVSPIAPNPGTIVPTVSP